MYQNIRKARFAYEQNEVLNLSPVQITERLYKALGKSLRISKDGLLEGNPARKGENIGKAVSILGELRASLDLEQGGEIASNLSGLYAYLINELTTANLKNEVTRIDRAIKVVDPLIAAWSELAKREAAKNALATGPAEHDQPMAVHAAY